MYKELEVIQFDLHKLVHRVELKISQFNLLCFLVN